jgi:hypothetical protein
VKQRVPGGMREHMAAFAMIADHRIIRERKRYRCLLRGQQAQLADVIVDATNCRHATAFRIVRTALDLLGFGDPVSYDVRNVPEAALSELTQ